MTVKPYDEQGSKREQVERMFDGISPRYDLLNRMLSMGIDQGWRRRVLRHLRREPVERLLDVATGTADLAIMGSRHAGNVTGVDISEGMLAQGRTKVDKRGLGERVVLSQSDAESLPFADGSYDAVTVAFGVRNFEHLDAGLLEMVRVLRPGGRLFVLEFSKPVRAPWRQLFRLYFHNLLPLAGRLISRDKAAYTYLPKSVEAFPEGAAFLERMAQAGLGELRAERLTGGVATLYTGRRG